MLLPAFTGSGESVLESWRSACAATVVVAVALSLPELPSDELDVTVAVFDNTVPAATFGATFTIRVKADPPTAKLAFVQVIVPPAPTAGVVHDQPATEDS